MALQFPSSVFQTQQLVPSPCRTSAFRHSIFKTRASEEDSSEPEASSDPALGSDDNPDFESRLSQVRLRYRSGSGKKAEVRKTKKGKKTSSGSSSSVFLPPVSLKEPMSGGLNVDFGFSPYSERINGRIAMLGLSALLLVELATGKSVINFHSPSIIFVQVYFVAAMSAIYIKVEKEKVSVWPQSAPPPVEESKEKRRNTT